MGGRGRDRLIEREVGVNLFYSVIPLPRPVFFPFESSIIITTRCQGFVALLLLIRYFDSHRIFKDKFRVKLRLLPYAFE